MNFSRWWVKEFGHPPLQNENELFEHCRNAYDEGRKDGPSPPSVEARREQLTTWNEGAIFYEEYDEALVGICFRFGRDPIALYDMDRCLEILMKDAGDYDEASDHFWTNTMGAWVGDFTPAFVKRFE